MPYLLVVRLQTVGYGNGGVLVQGVVACLNVLQFLKEDIALVGGHAEGEAYGHFYTMNAPVSQRILNGEWHPDVSHAFLRQCAGCLHHATDAVDVVVEGQRPSYALLSVPEEMVAQILRDDHVVTTVVEVVLCEGPSLDEVKLVEMEEPRVRQSTLHGILMHAVGQRDAEQGVRPHLHLSGHVLRRLHLLEQVTVHLIMDILNVVFVVQQRHVVQIVRRAAVYLWRNVSHLHVIHFSNEHHEGHGQCRARDIHRRVEFLLAHHGEGLSEISHICCVILSSLLYAKTVPNS